MLYIILLLILAVLLFGASAVIGVLGYALGFIAAAIALIWAAVAFQIEPIYVMILGVVGFFGICGLIMLIATIVQPWELERMKRKGL